MVAAAPGANIRNRDMTAAWRHVDFVLLAFVAGTVAFGALMIYSATRHAENPTEFIEKHALFVVIGVAVMAVASLLDYEKLSDLSAILYVGAVVALGLVLVPGIGSVHNNIRAWYDLGPFQLQPAEIAKLATILALATYLGRLQEVRLRHLITALVMLAVPIGLILMQPDLGTALVFVFIGMGMMVVGGVPVRYLVGLVLIGVIGVAGILTSGTLDEYQTERLTSFVSPDQASAGAIYNTKAAQTAIASGGLTGQGLFEGPQTAGGFVPEQQTDFIFTVTGEELGFAGSALLIVLLGGIVWRVWRTAQIARDPVGRLICVGVLCMIMFHVFQNIGMSLGIMPVTGIPLPFVSYGGSATLTTFAALGLVMNVHMRRFG
jgi:rod shape determining protein RodA